MLLGTMFSPILVILDRQDIMATADNVPVSGEWREFLERTWRKSNINLDSVSYCLAEDTEIIKKHESNVLVPVGEHSLNKITGLYGIMKWQASVIKSSAEFNFKKCIPVIHPQIIAKTYSWQSLNSLSGYKIKQEMTFKPLNTPQRIYHVKPSFKEALEFLKHAQTMPRLGIDIETGQGQINTFGVAINKLEAMAIRIDLGFWTPEQNMMLWLEIAKLVESQVPKYYQNFIYETLYLSRYGIRTNGVAFDTMWAMKFLNPELDKGLDNVGRFYTPFPYWKDDRDDWNNIRDWNSHLIYNCLAKGMKVHTEHGLIPIDKIAKEKMQLKVSSFNEEKNCFELKPVTNWLVKREKKKINWVQIKTTGMSGKHGLLVTEDHKIFTQKGWLRADKLSVGDFTCVESIRHNVGALIGTYLGDSSITNTSDSSVAYLTCGQVSLALIKYKQLLFGGTISSAMRTGGYKTNAGMMHTLYVPASVQLARIKKLSTALAIDSLNSIGIALWVMDDGCKQKGKCQSMRLAVQSYSKEEQQHILKFFTLRYGKCSLHKAGNIAFSKAASAALCTDIGPYVIPEMRYKLSHEAPSFCLPLATKFKSSLGSSNKRITALNRVIKNKRGYSTSYCISVKDNNNFLTEFGVVANCNDTIGTLWAAEEMEEELKERGLHDLFNNYIMRLVPVVTEMCSNGLLVDLIKLDSAKIESQEKLNNLNLIIKEIFLERVGKEVNVRSPKQLKSALTEMGIKLPTKTNKNTGESGETADKKALVKLARKYPDEIIIQRLMDISKENKHFGSYLSFDFNPDNNIVNYTLDGCSTETLRMAGYTDPWGRGFNIQTIPKGIRKLFKARKGNMLAEIDLASAESYYVAYDSPEPKLMDLLHSGGDIHKYVAGKIYHKDESMVSKQERQLGKKSGHAANYGVGPRTFAESCLVEMGIVISEQEAKRIIAGYFQAFPGIKRRQLRIQQEIRRFKKISLPWGHERYFYDRISDSCFREAYAYAPQATIPFITNNLLLFLYKNFPALEFKAQIHDAILFESDKETLLEVSEAIKDYKAWHPEIILPGGKMIIPAVMEVGTHWQPMVKL